MHPAPYVNTEQMLPDERTADNSRMQSMELVCTIADSRNMFWPATEQDLAHPIRASALSDFRCRCHFYRSFSSRMPYSALLTLFTQKFQLFHHFRLPRIAEREKKKKTKLPLSSPGNFG